MEESLIAAVFKRKAIWDPTDELRKNSKILNSLWAQVANEIGVDVKAAKSKWKNLRAYFVTEHRKTELSKTGTYGSVMKTSSWSRFNQLMFLKDTLGTYDEARDGSLTTQNAFCSQQTSVETMIPEECVESELGLPSIDEQPETGTTVQPTTVHIDKDQESTPAESSRSNFLFRRTQTNKRKLGQNGLEKRYTTARRAAEFLAVEKRKVTLLEKEIDSDNNPDLQFFKSLIPYMADFTPIQKLRIRSKIQEIILNEHEQNEVTASYSRAPPETYTSLDSAS